MSTEAVLKTLEHVWRTLEPLGVPMAVAGGMALATWKHPRTTRDVDLLISVEKSQMPTLINSLNRAGVAIRGDGRLVELTGCELLQLEYEPPGAFVSVQVDLLIVRCVYQRQALGRRVATSLPQMSCDVYVLACEDMIINKLLAGRVIDRADAAALVRANHETLDRAYLRNWLARLQLERDFAEICREALPDQSFD